MGYKLYQKTLNARQIYCKRKTFCLFEWYLRRHCLPVRGCLENDHFLSLVDKYDLSSSCLTLVIWPIHYDDFLLCIEAVVSFDKTNSVTLELCTVPI